MLVERDGKLELPDSILDPTLTFETSGFSFTFEGLFKAEIVLREKGREVERIASKPTGRAGVDLVVASGGRLHIPAQYALGVEGEIILYYSDGSKQEFDLTTGQPVQIELRITPALIAAEGEQKASNHGVKITVMHTNGQPFILECSDNLANWQELQAYPYPEDEEVFVDGEETSHRFYRVRVIE